MKYILEDNHCWHRLEDEAGPSGARPNFQGAFAVSFREATINGRANLPYHHPF